MKFEFIKGSLYGIYILGIGLTKDKYEKSINLEIMLWYWNFTIVLFEGKNDKQ